MPAGCESPGLRSSRRRIDWRDVDSGGHGVNGADEVLRPGREERVALLGDWGDLTYGALNARVNQWGHGLRERGVTRGDRVVLHSGQDNAI